MAAGIRAIWLNRHHLPLAADVRPSAEISTLSDLSSVLKALEVRA